MGWVTNLAIFFVIWWIALFAILPLRVRSQIEDGAVVPGSADGAPSEARIGWKMMMTTLLALLIFALFYLVTQVLGIGPEDFPHIVPGT